MGYDMVNRGCNFEIKKNNVPLALEALKNYTREYDGLRSVNFEKVENSENLNEALHEWSWNCSSDNNGDVNRIWFSESDGYMTDDFRLLQCIANFVEPDSYIEMEGEDGDIWRWIFDGNSCAFRYPTIIWD